MIVGPGPFIGNKAFFLLVSENLGASYNRWRLIIEEIRYIDITCIYTFMIVYVYRFILFLYACGPMELSTAL